jgi:REP element-mobilizing transposase RayT
MKELRNAIVAGASSSGIESKPEQDAPATISPDWATLAIRQGDNLPHWSCDRAIYHVSFRLVDSVPKSKLEDWAAEREQIVATARQLGRDLSEHEEERLRYLYSEKIEAHLDQGHGECWLRQPDVAMLVADALRHFNGQRYSLHAWCIMPNHVHVIVQPMPGNPLPRIVHSWKSYTASVANRELGREGQFWQHEPYDHIIRSGREYAFQVDYTWKNPDKAGISAPRWKVAGASSSGIESKPEQDAPATYKRMR